MPFRIIRNDITKVEADAIVNTANPKVTVGDGVDYAIYEAAGRDRLLAARKKIGILNPGEAGITPAFDLAAKFIIHVISPRWKGGDKGEAELLRKCYDESLRMAYEKGCKSIAYPLLATGTYQFPRDLGIKIATDAFKAFLEEHEMEITLVVFGEDAYRISGELFDDVESFINQGYVEDAECEEYARDRNLRCEIADEEECDFLEEIELFESDEAESFKVTTSAAEPPQMFLGAPMSEKSLEESLKEIYKDSFGEHLQQLINKKGLKSSEVYAAANISKQYFSKLLNDKVKPSKEKMLALAVGLRLNMDETVDFLRLAGYALSPISQTDKIVEYFIRKHEYNVMQIDIVLYEYGLDPLS